jgi:hypothetical protein
MGGDMVKMGGDMVKMGGDMVKMAQPEGHDALKNT